MYDHVVTMYISYNSQHNFWCLLKQHVSAHVFSLKMAHVGRNISL